MTNSSRVSELCKSILESRPIVDGRISLDEFKQLYHCIASSVDIVPLVHIALLGMKAICQFTDISSAQFIVSHDRRITPRDFTGTVSRAVIFGDKLSYSIKGQIKEEKRNALPLIVMFLSLVIASFWMGWQPALHYGSYLRDPASYGLVEVAIESLARIIDLLVTSATLFISIFLVFTVAQNVGMLRDDYLFNEGLAHKYYRDDRFISVVALSSLLIGVAAAVILGVPSALELSLPAISGTRLHLNKFSVLLPILVAASGTGLTLCFLSILYYFERVVINMGVIVAQRGLVDARKRVLARLQAEKLKVTPQRKPKRPRKRSAPDTF
jgi:energy-converting hydrogenase Eha subunit A